MTDLTQIKALPVVKQIELMQEIAASAAFGDVTNEIMLDLYDALTAAHRDATDQAAAENDALHGKEVSQLTDMWVSPCGMRVGG